MPTPPFVPALQLSGDFYREVVSPLLRDHRHSAALLGTGSEVLGYDTKRSTDHDWGPRLQIFVAPGAVEAARDAVAGRLPEHFRGWPVSIGSDEREPAQRVDVQPLGNWLVGQLGVDPRNGLDTLDWLAIPQQQLLGVVRGAVFTDPDHELAAVRDQLAWYPYDVWLWLLACQWTRIFQEIAFVGRAAEVGDDLGSKIITARLARELMRLHFLQHKHYWPYTIIAVGHNRLGVTQPVDWSIGSYFSRPYQLLHGDFAESCLARIRDDQLRRLPLVGSVDQFVDSTDVLSGSRRSRLLRQ